MSLCYCDGVKHCEPHKSNMKSLRLYLFFGGGFNITMTNSIAGLYYEGILNPKP